MIRIMKGLFALSLLAPTASAWASQSPLSMENCHLDGIKQQVKCGKLQVPENYQDSNGAKISINFAVLPAIDNSQNKSPLMFLAGGPGQAAVELAEQLDQGFREIRKTRDLILVDQRGTGKSHPLQCEESRLKNIYEIIPEDLSEQEIKDCLAKFNGDLSQYNSENSIRDFDAVRVALGHQKINIYGGSYGTRAGLVYMRLFPDSLNSVVLDSVGPIEVPIGTFGKSAARSFELLLSHCQQEAQCNQAYPGLESEFAQVMQRLAKQAVKLTITHPRLGSKTPFILSTGKFVSQLRMQLYTMQTRSLVPLIIHQAFLENYQPLIGLIAATESGQGIYLGLTFNIVCNEDIPQITQQMFAFDADNSFGKNNSHAAWQSVCPLWPQYRPTADFYRPITANIPTLIL